MILKINLEGTKVLDKYASMADLDNRHGNKYLHTSVGKVISRSHGVTQANGFLWALVNEEGKGMQEVRQEAINQVQDIVLQRLMKNFKVHEQGWDYNKVKQIIVMLNT